MASSTSGPKPVFEGLPELVPELAPDGYPALRASAAEAPARRPTGVGASAAETPRPQRVRFAIASGPEGKEARAPQSEAACGRARDRFVSGNVVGDAFTPQEIEMLFAAREPPGVAPAEEETKGAAVPGAQPGPSSPRAELRPFVSSPVGGLAGRGGDPPGVAVGAHLGGPRPADGGRSSSVSPCPSARRPSAGDPAQAQAQDPGGAAGPDDEALAQLTGMVTELATLRDSVDKLTVAVSAVARVTTMLVHSVDALGRGAAKGGARVGAPARGASPRAHAEGRGLPASEEEQGPTEGGQAEDAQAKDAPAEDGPTEDAGRQAESF